MSGVIRSLSKSIVNIVGLTEPATVSLHQLLSAACARTEVIEEKSIRAAALSALEGRQVFAERLVELDSFEKAHPEALKRADQFLANYMESRQ